MTDKDSLVSGVARRYATALFELASEAGAIEATEAGLNQFMALVDESADLRRLIESPVFSSDEQVAGVTAVLGAAGIGGIAANFIKLVARNRRLFLAPSMVRAYRALTAAARGETVAEVTSAEPLSSSHVEALKAALGEATGRKIILETSVDPALIGGLVVKLGSRMIDTSLRTKLNSLKLAMKEVG
ncbi:ATP synthase F1 subcomplex delta subunit [Pseudoxanthobacter soli DSM 19599]|uniref:ATP synthase subunit delta n=1 Tax=Pseudoxanthobacter soli DSM 19599 TaxID=1123029 RepID=A0A1M7Z4N0_9HYPH|nr:F0F1 ATP synthase subunit delta [Pseudoxanthobacter soli]SHO59772.1 ATP synthase F1 subcomplex delta subunit [Pseudoxanthobacter soli DSM 19599]